MWLNRACALASVSLLIAGLHALEPDAARRQTWLYLVALPLGYGHLLGGLLFARRRLATLLGSTRSPLTIALVGSAISTLLAIYLSLLHDPRLGPAVVVALLLVSAWHIAENDIELGHAYGRGLALGGLRRSLPEWLAISSFAVLVSLAALATPSGVGLCRWYGITPPLSARTTVADLATLVLLYHAASWVLFALERARRVPAPAGRAMRRRLLWVHAAPLAANALAYVWVEPVFRYLAMPTLYLFWSALHALQTAFVRWRNTQVAASPRPVATP